MAILGWIALAGFIVFILSAFVLFLDLIIKGIVRFGKKKIKNPFIEYESQLFGAYFMGLVAFIIGVALATITHDPVILQIDASTTMDVLQFVEQNIYLAVAGVIVFVGYLYKRIDDLFKMFQNEETGAFKRINRIEAKVEVIEKDTNTIKEDVKKLLIRKG